MPTLLNYFLFIIAFSSLLLVALSYLEPIIQIWCARSESSRFWRYFDKLLLTLRYLAATEEKFSNTRASLTTAANVSRAYEEAKP
jgi:hypothetical protein